MDLRSLLPSRSRPAPEPEPACEHIAPGSDPVGACLECLHDELVEACRIPSEDPGRVAPLPR